MTPDKTLQLAIKYHQAGDIRQAEHSYREILKIQPDNFYALHYLGVLYYQTKKYDLAITYIEQALQSNPHNSHAFYNLAVVFNEKGQLDEAITYYQKALQLNPDFPDAYNGLGAALKEKGQFDDAITCYQKALQLNPDFPDAYNNLGVVLKEKGQLDEAIACYKKALQLNPNLYDPYNNLGIVFKEKGQLDQAIDCYKKALQINSDFPDAHNGLGIVLQEKGQFDEAVSSYKKALYLNQNYVEAYNNLGTAFQAKGQLDEAVSCYQKTLQLNPNLLEAYNNLGNSYKDQGNLDQAEKCYRNALSIKPDCSFCYSNLLLSTNYNPQNDAKTIFSEHLQFAKRFEEPLLSAISPHKNERSLSRRLKIGYVSPDFRRHSVYYFTEPVLASHSHKQFEVFCYSDVLSPDNVTERLQHYADQWRSIVGMSDEKVAELIRNDGIDILIDLAGHTGYNRMLLFARKPAPVQVSWLGYPNTTGLSSIEYRIVDHYTDPPGLTDPFYTEKLIRLPESFLCYMPDKDCSDVAELPALTSGKITFGSFNYFPKISTKTAMLWAEVLKAIPHARLIMKAKSFSDKVAFHNAMKMFTAQGIALERIELLSHLPSFREHLETYNRIDICLDTFPYNGTTTTCEALWMGVPVITLAGDTHASRVGLSLLSTIGLSDLIANTQDEYMSIAVDLAKDLDRLQTLRKGLRDMMSHSPLTDAKRFIFNLESCYYKFWKDWCDSS